MSSLSACEGTTGISLTPCPAFKRGKQSSTDTAKSRIRRDVVKSDLANLSECSNSEDDVLFDGNEK